MHAVFGCKAADSLRFTLANSSGHDATQLPHDVGSHFGECDFCNGYKLIAQPHTAASSHATAFGGRVFIDDLGPLPTACIISGGKYVRKFTDEATNIWAPYPVKDYHSAETVAIVKMFMGDHAHLLPRGSSYTIVRTDGASILRAVVVRDLFDRELVTAEASMPRVPQQMGQNEASGRVVVRSGNAMRARARAAGLPCGPEYAALSIMYAADVHNFSFTTTWRG